MTINLPDVIRSATTSVTPPTPAQVTRALLALAHAVDAGQVTLIRDIDGEYTDVGTVALDPRVGTQIADDLLAGLVPSRVEEWTGDSGLRYQDTHGLLLSMRVKVQVCLGSVEQVAARNSVALAGAR